MSARLSSLQFLLVDDNPSFLSILEILLVELGAKHILKATSVTSGYNCFMEHEPDICLLDIELTPGEKDGALLGRKIRGKNAHVPIIYLTSYFQSDYYEAVKDVWPSSFMNKELSRLKVLQAIELATAQLPRRSDEKKSRLSSRVKLTKLA